MILVIPFKTNGFLPQEAVNWFSGLPNVHPGGVGVVGVSMGGEIGLWMAVHCPQVRSPAAGCSK